MDCKDLMMELSACVGVAGAESAVAQKCAGMLQDMGAQVTITPLGNLLATLRPASADQPMVLLDAHIDEIGLIVTSVGEDGFLRVSNCGGVDRRLLLAQRVIIHGREEVYGIIASKPPHLETAEEEKKVPEIDEIVIDTGLTGEQAKALISPGDMVTIDVEPTALLNGRICGKALDDRAGVAAVLRAVELLRDKPLSCGLTVLLSAQEETGERGAKTGGFTAAPDIALAVDVSFAYTADADEHKCGKMGEGPMIGIAPTLTRAISEQFIELAKAEKIPYQLEVMGGETSTNADALGVAGRGAKTGLLSIPLRYMHTPIEVVQTDDVENTARLLAAFIEKAGEADV